MVIKGDKMDAINTGKFICKLRKENNLTQASLAEKLNISNRTVSKWENGDGFPDITILPEIAKTLGVTVDELLAGERKEKQVADIKVTAIESQDKLNNFFMICYVISVFIGVFGALLGGINEIYCTWAFYILFYTHWEIIFAAVSLFAIITSGLVFSVGVIRLNMAYTKEEIIKKVLNKGFALSMILAFFPATFIHRIIKFMTQRIIPPLWFYLIFIAIFAIIYLALFLAYKKIKENTYEEKS